MALPLRSLLLLLSLGAPLCSAFTAPSHLGLALSASNLAPRCSSRSHAASANPRANEAAVGAGSLAKLSTGSGGFGGRGNGGGGGIRRWGSGGGGGDEGSSSWGPGEIWASYLSLLDTDPLKTRMATSFVISVLGDLLAQSLEGVDVKVLDFKRILLFALWGSFGFTPMGYQWYNFIEATIPQDIPARFLAKMIMDQAIFPPLMITLTFTTLTVVEGLFAGIGLTISKGLFATGDKVKDVGTLFNDGISKVKKEIVPTLLENYKVWPAAQVLTFGVIPLRLQLLFVNLVAVWWNSVLSLTQHKKEPVKPKGRWGRK